MLEHLGISDPGEEIVEKAIENGIQIVPVPGACALIHALVASGLSTREFLFLGFLSTNHKEKRAIIKQDIRRQKKERAKQAQREKREREAQ